MYHNCAAEGRADTKREWNPGSARSWIRFFGYGVGSCSGAILISTIMNHKCWLPFVMEHETFLRSIVQKTKSKEAEDNALKSGVIEESSDA